MGVVVAPAPAAPSASSVPAAPPMAAAATLPGWVRTGARRRPRARHCAVLGASVRPWRMLRAAPTVRTPCGLVPVGRAILCCCGVWPAPAAPGVAASARRLGPPPAPVQGVGVAVAVPC